MYLQYVLICVMGVLLLLAHLKPVDVVHPPEQHALYESFVNADRDSRPDTPHVVKPDETTVPSTTTSKPEEHSLVRMVTKIKRLANFDSATQLLAELDGIRASFMPAIYSFDPKDTDDREVVSVLWSGGVASTFRICELLFIYKRHVRPVYLEQTDLDERQSYTQERHSVKALHTYICDTLPPDATGRLLPTQIYESPIRQTPNNTEIRKRLAFIFDTHPHNIDNFYLYLVKLRGQQEQSFTELSKKPIELVLPEGGPHHLLRNAVETWGARFVRLTKKNVPDTRTPQLQMLQCTFIVPPIADEDTDLHIDQRKQKEFANFFSHIHFVLPCQDALYQHRMIDTYALKPILKRAWTCRHPVQTPHQSIIQKNKIKRNVFLHTSFPLGYCDECVSCQLRHKDGIERLAPNLFKTRKKSDQFSLT